MRILLIILLILHVVPGVFWVGSTFVLARAGGPGAEQLTYPQLGASVVTMLAGVVLWGLLHRAGFGTFELVLAVGVICAIAAAGVQSGMVIPAIRQLGVSNDAAKSALWARIAAAERIAAGLLTVTVITMFIARYV